MNIIIDNSEFHMWGVLILTVWAAYSYIREKLSIEVTSVAVLTVLLLFGQIFPLFDANGRNLLDASAMLSGFANPALVAVLALLVMGQAIIYTDALRPLTNILVTKSRKWAKVSILTIMLFVLTMSAFINNTPLVVLVIPVFQALAKESGFSESRIMIPLSYVAILGGMTTLIGSSTNMLVSSSMLENGYNPLGFFDFFVPGTALAGLGLFYVLLVVPQILPDRKSLPSQFVTDKKEFIAELDVTKDSALIGSECADGKFSELKDVSVKLIQRAGHLILPPFEGYVLKENDILIVAATRDTLGTLLSKNPGYLLSDEEKKMAASEAAKPAEVRDASEETDENEDEVRDKDSDQRQEREESRILAEVMVTPGSRLVDMAIDRVGFQLQFNTVVLGVQRRARVVRRRLGRIRLEPGDVLLVAGTPDAVDSMQKNQDLIVLSGSKKELPVPRKAPVAAGIMVSTIGLAALNVLSIPVAAITGCILLISTGCLNIRQATRAIDRKIFLLVGSMLALGTALQATGGAIFIADSFLALPFLSTPFSVASALFLMVAILTNILSNNACAILFTPIAISIATNLGVDPYIFAVMVVFAANCSFASPIGYQTNLLVMGPGHYRFRDFIKAGLPLVFLLWLGYMVLAKTYYGL